MAKTRGILLDVDYFTSGEKKSVLSLFVKTKNGIEKQKNFKNRICGIIGKTLIVQLFHFPKAAEKNN